jgi:hypothetical protein
MLMDRKFLWLILIVAVGSPAALYLWREANRDQPQSPPAPASIAEPPIRYPIEADGSAAESLPPLGDSDGIVRRALAALFGPRLENLFISQDIVRRVVATVDNLPRDHVSSRLMPVKPAHGLLLTTQTERGLALGPENAARYRPYVRLAQAVPTDKLVAVYTRFYPLLQQQYEGLGYPDGYFNDRVVQVIDHMLATPDVDGPLLLVQERVLYEFADPTLEELSAGQKILLRIGAENRVKIKAKLREIRQALTSQNAIEDFPAP